MKIRSLVLQTILAASLAPAVLRAQAAPPVTDPAEFAKLAASSNMFEIESSELALTQAEDGNVRAFAEHMIQDHTAAGEKMKAAATRDGVVPLTRMAEKEQAELDRLKADDGKTFDQTYLTDQVAAHDEAVALFEGFSTAGQESALRAFAAETLPTLRAHQAAAHELAEAR